MIVMRGAVTRTDATRRASGRPWESAASSTPTGRSCAVGCSAGGPGQPAGEMPKVRRALPCAGEVTQAGGEHPTLTLAKAPREWKPEARPFRTGGAEVELRLGHSEQHVSIGSQVAELVHLVPPAPGRAEMRSRGMVGVDDVEVHLLRPGMAVEARAHQPAVVVPAVTGVGGRMDRHDRDPAGPHALEQRGALSRSPRCLT